MYWAFMTNTKYKMRKKYCCYTCVDVAGMTKCSASRGGQNGTDGSKDIAAGYSECEMTALHACPIGTWNNILKQAFTL